MFGFLISKANGSLIIVPSDEIIPFFLGVKSILDGVETSGVTFSFKSSKT